MHDLPLFYDLWWNGIITRVEVQKGSKGSVAVGVDVIWNIMKVPISEELWGKKMK